MTARPCEKLTFPDNHFILKFYFCDGFQVKKSQGENNFKEVHVNSLKNGQEWKETALVILNTE